MVEITKIETDSLVMGKIFFCAFRYCLGRETAAPSMFIEYFTAPNFWNAITKETKYQNTMKLCITINYTTQINNT